MEIYIFLRFNNRRIIKFPKSFKCRRIKSFPCAALKTTAISRIRLGERSA